MNSISTLPSDVLVIGGGVIGLLTSRFLATEGLRVTVIEADRIGSQSSWAGGGILSPLCPWRAPEPITALCRISQALYPQLAAELLEETGVDPEWTRSGVVFIDSEETAAAQDWCSNEAVACQMIDSAALNGLEPHLNPATTDSLWLPSIAQVRNPRLLKALRASLEGLGVSLLEGQKVIAFEAKDDGLTAVRTAAGRFAADRFVVAAGAWTGRLMADLTPPLPITPVKGQMLAFAAPPGTLSRIIVRGDRYLIPRRDGVILAGSTVEATEFDKFTTESAQIELADFARALLPQLQTAGIVRHWAGLRPGTPNGIPYIDRHPDLKNLFLCAGHFRNGFVMAPASCRTLVDLILDRPSPVPLPPYSLSSAH